MTFKKDMTYKEYLNFLFPSIVMMLSISIYVVIDAYFVSKYIGSDALASINLIIPVNSLIFAIGLMFAAGGGAHASIKLGEKDIKTASVYFTNLLIIGLVFAIFLMILTFIFQDQLLTLLGVSDELYTYAKPYSSFIFLTLPVLMAKIILAGFLRAEGSPKVSLKMSLLGGFVNLILDYLFIVELHLGMFGAGLASFLGLLVAVLYGLMHFKSSRSILSYRFILAPFSFIKTTIFNGSSEMVNELAIGFTTFIFNMLTMKHAGSDGVASISVILYIHFLISSAYIGFSIGTAPLLSYQYGAKQKESLKKIMQYAKKTLLISSPLLLLFVLLFNPVLLSIFLKPSNPAYAIAEEGLYLFSFTFLFIGLNMYASAFYTALSNGKVSAFISFGKTFVLFSLFAYTFPKFWGIQGIWLIMPATEGMTACLVLYLMQSSRQMKFNAF